MLSKKSQPPKFTYCIIIWQNYRKREQISNCERLVVSDGMGVVVIKGQWEGILVMIELPYILGDYIHLQILKLHRTKYIHNTHMSTSKPGESLRLVDCINSNILITIWYYILQDLTIGRNGIKNIWDLCIISCNFI